MNCQSCISCSIEFYSGDSFIHWGHCLFCYSIVYTNHLPYCVLHQNRKDHLHQSWNKWDIPCISAGLPFTCIREVRYNDISLNLGPRGLPPMPCSMLTSRVALFPAISMAPVNQAWHSHCYVFCIRIVICILSSKGLSCVFRAIWVDLQYNFLLKTILEKNAVHNSWYILVDRYRVIHMKRRKNQCFLWT